MVLFCIGPSCSGKTTYIQKHFSDIKVIDLFDYQKNLPFFTVDNIFESYIKCLNDLVEYAKTGNDVVLEHTLLLAKRRKMYIEALHKENIFDIEVIVFKPEPDVLLKRKEKRGLRIDLVGVKEELNLLEMPSINEGFKKITVINQ